MHGKSLRSHDGLKQEQLDEMQMQAEGEWKLKGGRAVAWNCMSCMATVEAAAVE